MCPSKHVRARQRLNLVRERWEPRELWCVGVSMCVDVRVSEGVTRRELMCEDVRARAYVRECDILAGWGVRESVCSGRVSTRARWWARAQEVLNLRTQRPVSSCVCLLPFFSSLLQAEMKLNGQRADNRTTRRGAHGRRTG